ncbi:hypothetical protein GUH47_18190 [Xanthomonas citri pv. citri]|nr:hypothetical protein [Xanthomonas citri pv. citri]
MSNIPAEMRERRQWAGCTISHESDPNHKRPVNPKTGFWASTTNPQHWGTFEQAVQWASKAENRAIGFMLSKADPYCIIDLDNKEDNPVSDETLAWYDELAKESGSYVERSISGRGLHVVIKAEIESGRKKNNCEIYDNDRFMICTGDVVHALPIKEDQELATWFWEQLESEGSDEPIEMQDVDELISDDDIMEMAWNADNGSKFQELWWGDWRSMGYDSQSEADLALMSMLAFYSESNAQCLRLFRMSELGKREKAVKDDKYLYHETLRQVRTRQGPKPKIMDLDELRKSMEAFTKPLAPPARSIPEVDFVYKADAGDLLKDETEAPHIPETTEAGFTLPPGIIGEIAEYVYSSSHRPVPEIAIATAFGFVAGVAGRAYNISQVGLNQYIVLLAKTGTGKEAIGQGIDRMFSAARRYCPQADTFQGPAAFASGQSLARILPEKPCFVSTLGEFGLLLQGMTKAKPGEPAHTLKRALLDIYNKSGVNSWLKPTVYSDREKNTELVQAPNVTFVGESTPHEFYKALDESAIMDGFVPRLMLLEYKGDRPELNEHAGHPPSDLLVRKVAEFINTALGATSNPDGITVTNIVQDREAAKLLRAFNDEIDAMFHGMDDGPNRQILNRVHLKAIKLAGLLAVGVNWHDPVVTVELAEWAIDFTRREMTTMMARFESGEVGEGDDAHRFTNAVRTAIMRVLDADKQEASTLRNSYRFPPKLEGTTIIPHSFLARYLKGRQPFKGDKRGPGRALDETIREMLTAGDLVKLSEGQAKGQYGLLGAAYSIGGLFK